MDVREQILVRLLEILTAVAAEEPFATVHRNKTGIPNDARPAFVLLDGDESARLTGDRRGRVKMSPTLMTMRPQIYVVLKDKKPQNEQVGQDLNAYRLRLVQDIANDTSLQTLVSTNGNIAYEAAETDLNLGSEGKGQVLLTFAITYVFDPFEV